MRVAVILGAMALGLLVTPASGQVTPPSVAQPARGSTVERVLLDAKDAMSVKPDTALSLTQRAEQLLATLPPNQANLHALAEALWLQGEAYLRLGKKEDAAARIERAFQLATRMNDQTKLRGEILLSRGWLATKNANVAEALRDYQDAHNIFHNLKEHRSQAKALKQIAVLYREAGDFKIAQRYDRQASEIYPDDPMLQMSTFNNLGNQLAQMKQYDEAEIEYVNALNIARMTKSKINEAWILRNIARVQIQSKKLNIAEKTLLLSIKIDRESAKISKLSPYTDLLAQLAYERGNHRLAAKLVADYFSGVSLTTTDLSDRDVHETGFKAFQAVGRNDLALAHLEALKRLDDKTASLTASANTALMAARFDDANKDAKIANLKAEESRRKFEYEQARAQLLSWIIGATIAAALGVVSLLAFGLVTIRRSRNEVRAANVDLASANGALEKALAAKTEFLATTSHEIRTPLNGILGMTQVMLADQALPDPVRDRLDVVRAAGVTMKALVDDILDVAKMETGNMTIESVPVDLPKTLNDVSRLWDEQAQAKGVKFQRDLAHCPALVQGDPARIRQIVFNLLSNALKFTASGVITLRSEVVDGDRLRISVSDTGIGIPADKLEEIFESFKQVDAATTRKFGGTGLGLSICRNLARAMGGDIAVRSVMGEGSTFSVELPYQPLAAAEKSVDDVIAAQVVVIDAQPIMRSMLKTLLASHAQSVETASSIAEALERFDISRARLVLVDESAVRGADGGEAALARLVALAAPEAVRLLWTGGVDDALIERVLLASNDIIEKPVAGPALIARLFPFPSPAEGVATPMRVVQAA